jgi:DnaD/phage-associated family protein
LIIEEQLSKLYSDTPVADVFLSEYLPGLSGDAVKVYLFLHYLRKFGKKGGENELATLLNMDAQAVRNAMGELEAAGAVERRDRHILLRDLKEAEIGKHFAPRTTSAPEEAGKRAKAGTKRAEIIGSINSRFFQGLMPVSWFTDIDLWFDIYKFDEDVMFALFQHCYDYKAVNNKNYVQKVAAEWHARGIRNLTQLEAYQKDYEAFRDIRTKIARKLKLGRNLTEYEERYVFKWVGEYRFDFDIIEIALMKTAAKASPSISYIDGCLASWHAKGLRTKEAILKDIEDFKRQRGASARSAAQQKGNFEGRDLEADYFESLYSNPKKGEGR